MLGILNGRNHEEHGKTANPPPRLWNSQQKAQERFEQWEPQTREEAQQRWKEMQNTPDHLTLLHTYKRAGVEPIKLAK